MTLLIAESLEHLESRLERVVMAVESVGLRVNRGKTEVMCCRWGDKGTARDIRVQGHVLNQMSEYRCLGSVVEDEGGIDSEVKSRIQSGWCRWKEACGVLCGKRMPLKLKGKIYKSVVRPAMLYSGECWAVSKKQEQQLKIAEMRTLRWSLGVTRKDRMENKYVRGAFGVCGVK